MAGRITTVHKWTWSLYLWDTLWGERRSDAHTSYYLDYQWPVYKRHSCPYCCTIYILKYRIQVSVFVFITVVHQQSSTKIHGVSSSKTLILLHSQVYTSGLFWNVPTDSILNFRTALVLAGLRLAICNTNSPHWSCSCRWNPSDDNKINKGDDAASNNAAYFV
jgi:hypothetical protein